MPYHKTDSIHLQIIKDMKPTGFRPRLHGPGSINTARVTFSAAELFSHFCDEHGAHRSVTTYINKVKNKYMEKRRRAPTHLILGRKIYLLLCHEVAASMDKDGLTQVEHIWDMDIIPDLESDFRCTIVPSTFDNFIAEAFGKED